MFLDYIIVVDILKFCFYYYYFGIMEVIGLVLDFVIDIVIFVLVYCSILIIVFKFNWVFWLFGFLYLKILF